MGHFIDVFAKTVVLLITLFFIFAVIYSLISMLGGYLFLILAVLILAVGAIKDD